MYIEETDYLRVECHICEIELELKGVRRDDLVNRTEKGRKLIADVAREAKGSTGDDWPGCAYTFEMSFKENEVILAFSERVDDYLDNLKNISEAMDDKDRAGIEGLIENIESADDEDDAREVIRRFEEMMAGE